MLPGSPALWLGGWVARPTVTIGVDDVAQWPYTPGLLFLRILVFGLMGYWMLTLP